jgi:hypothetical protein
MGSFQDHSRYNEASEERRKAQAYLDLMTPVAKAWASDLGCIGASTGIQVLGGAGFIEEVGMAQHLRDIRIAPIYEGTNGIQAIDLVLRKLPRNRGRWVRTLLSDMAATLSQKPSSKSGLRDSYSTLADAVAVLASVTECLLSRTQSEPQFVLAGASPYLELMGYTLGGWLMLRRALWARTSRVEDPARTDNESEFYATEFTSRAIGLGRPILAGMQRLGS